MEPQSSPLTERRTCGPSPGRRPSTLPSGSWPAVRMDWLAFAVSNTGSG